MQLLAALEAMKGERAEIPLVMVLVVLDINLQMNFIKI